VQVRVANTGGRDGEEVVQAYLVPTTAAAGGGTTPVLQRQLVGFTRLAVPRGKTRTASFTLDPRSLSLVARDGTRTVEPGAYRIFVGGGQPGTAPGAWIDLTITGDRQELPK
jgi:beta-glucosidase